ncbi:UDP-N-acetylmuramoyl-tripeptide--D-alanyl-D-alanine ligase [Dermabacter sp. p3-SID358]|uniref:UDP-N-acetylmuramoyl-tripeptide--D-alanyl-D- alanine ligase n=1 Tax=Dermabacter sp. p3-SID358 TaxID=2916114 RepID=UPI0021A2D807|nr:UDP-N-acetylmuramoyl-tripeptide--D-alanyl-D-alanine ligase [Dermabacter sp. p3-SID358]MCT1867279.1 UDP-N-acetylmuramoyl-tripeptide--D-alanyl-D-alanine ligase [Dermabacter sp. p3-SID358]
MRKTTTGAIARLLGGRLVGTTTGEEHVHGKASVDSRAIGAGDLFVAFEGEHVDGHDFIEAAAKAGAAAALVTREDRELALPAIQVEDPLAAIETLARHELADARASVNPPTVIALTGSNGKTSTKDLLHAILAPVGETIAPVGSRNNELGLPLTVLELTETTRFLVLEMGARGIGHIRHLTNIARPDISLVLNVGSAHLGEFGGVENIALAKGELVEALDENGVAVLNADDARVAAMASRTGAHAAFFSRMDDSAEAYASDVRLDALARASFTLHMGAHAAPIALTLTGEHHVSNALAAAAAASAAGLSFDAIVSGLNAAEQRSPGRMQVSELPGGVTLINDAYNANPDSMRAGLSALAILGKERYTVAVLGEMLELGDGSAEAHRSMGQFAAENGIDVVVAIGEEARGIYEGVTETRGDGDGAVYVESLDDAPAVLETVRRPKSTFLLKSSNGAGLSKLGESLVHAWGAEPTMAENAGEKA